jgi:hypothetical protein
MSSTVKGFQIRDITQHAKGELGHLVVNPAKVLPATATGNLFACTGIVMVTGLFGVISTALAVTAVNVKIGITGNTAAIAANPAVAFASSGVGGAVVMPPTLGGALPAVISAQTAVAGSTSFVLNAANITITTDATNTGALTWVLSYLPLFPKSAGAVTAV